MWDDINDLQIIKVVKYTNSGLPKTGTTSSTGRKNNKSSQSTIKTVNDLGVSTVNPARKKKKRTSLEAFNTSFDDKSPTALTCVGNLVDPNWETVDPTPNIHVLFQHFNDRFFSSRLAGIEVRWSPRMTMCAGVCSYEGRSGLCSVRLSVPLLKLRPRKDLIQTLLHEMIHAFLFVTKNNRDRDGHGPEFQKHMHRINIESGTNITIYHSFHDEVRLYQQHWWRCSGVCRNRPPFHGWVKRSMNRKPGPYDLWWSEHHRTCGGAFIKVREPEKVIKNGKKVLPVQKGVTESKSSDIRKFFTPSPKKPKLNKVVGKSDPQLTGRPVSSVDPFEGCGRQLGCVDLTNASTSNQSSSSQSRGKLPYSTPTYPKMMGTQINQTKSGNPASQSCLKPPLSVGVMKSNNTDITIPKTASADNTSDRKQPTPVGSLSNPISIDELPPSLPCPNAFRGTGHVLGTTNSGLQQRPKSRLIEMFSHTSSTAKKKSLIEISKSTVLPKSTETTMVSCPVCSVQISLNLINDHLNNCLS